MCCEFLFTLGAVAYTVEPSNNGHFGSRDFLRCREVARFSECPLWEVPLYRDSVSMLMVYMYVLIFCIYMHGVVCAAKYI